MDHLTSWRRRGRRRFDRGFTLVEILVGIVLVGILTSVVVVGVGSLVQKGQTASCAQSRDAATVAATAHLTSTGNYPTSFSAMVSAGLLSLPGDATLDAGGTTLSTDRWRLSLTPGSATTPPVITCSDGTDFQVWAGMFESSTTAGGTAISDVLIPVDISKAYTITMLMRSGDDAGGQIDPATLHYAGYASYDADQRVILPPHVQRWPGATDTTLAAPLTVGDTTVSLADATGWYEGNNGYFRQFAWWPYTDGTGTTWAPYTYTRNLSQNRPGYGSNATGGTWGEDGVNGNTITLAAPWPGPSLPAGTPVRNNRDGGTYSYVLRANHAVPGAWTIYSRSVSGVNANPENDDYAKFRVATKYVKLLVLPNYTNTGGNLLRWKNGTFAQAS